ncbi:N-acetylneuraminate synthase family protein [Litorivicinus sp.]|nr:N-acetylneuraminate synthase family protein [Litorivicinus sp.]
MFIAEIGINHHGSVENAQQLITAARDAGCDAVKFQYRSRGFYHATDQIGDEILSSEIARTELNDEQLIELIKFSHTLGIQAGISFFRLEDFLCNKKFQIADFFKVPSAEHLNSILIDGLLGAGKPVFVSTGGANLEVFAAALGEERRSKLNVMHCVANYPVAFGHGRLELIRWLKKYNFKSVGYSSHDADYLNCLVAIGHGIASLERHIVLDKNDGGLDSSSSSTPDEMKILASYFRAAHPLAEQKLLSERNQGEILNMQNLGTGLYAKDDLAIGEVIDISLFDIQAPRLGLSVGEFTYNFQGAKLRKDLRKGEALSEKHFQATNLSPTSSESPEGIEYLKNMKVGLPVRLHDWEQVCDRFNVSTFEFHLSYGELSLLSIDNIKRKIDADHNYSIHLPDYVSRNELMNLFSSDRSVVFHSTEIIKRVIELGQAIEAITYKSVPIVGSFPLTSMDPDTFVEALKCMLLELGSGRILPQWLPVHGWYFGGHSKIETFNSVEYIEAVRKHDCKICLDIAHLIMSANYHGQDWQDWYRQLLPHTAHLHLSDADGIDGEGLAFGLGALAGKNIQVPLGFHTILEVWQGHLNDFEGFELALEYIAEERILWT